MNVYFHVNEQTNVEWYHYHPEDRNRSFITFDIDNPNTDDRITMFFQGQEFHKLLLLAGKAEEAWSDSLPDIKTDKLRKVSNANG